MEMKKLNKVIQLAVEQQKLVDKMLKMRLSVDAAEQASEYHQIAFFQQYSIPHCMGTYSCMSLCFVILHGVCWWAGSLLFSARLLQRWVACEREDLNKREGRRGSSDHTMKLHPFTYSWKCAVRQWVTLVSPCVCRQDSCCFFCWCCSRHTRRKYTHAKKLHVRLCLLCILHE